MTTTLEIYRQAVLETPACLSTHEQLAAIKRSLGQHATLEDFGEWGAHDIANVLAYGACGLVADTEKGCATEQDIIWSRIAHVAFLYEGQNDSDDWHVVLCRDDGRWLWISAGCDETGCDETGWDCQAGGLCSEAESLTALMRAHIPEGLRRYWSVELVADPGPIPATDARHGRVMDRPAIAPSGLDSLAQARWDALLDQWGGSHHLALEAACAELASNEREKEAMRQRMEAGERRLRSTTAELEQQTAGERYLIRLLRGEQIYIIAGLHASDCCAWMEAQRRKDESPLSLGDCTIEIVKRCADGTYERKAEWASLPWESITESTEIERADHDFKSADVEARQRGQG